MNRATAKGSVTVVEMTGNETDEQCKDIAWQMMCNAHPVEANAYDPDRFWKYFHARAPHMTREQMVELLKECEEPEDESPNEKLCHSRDDAAKAGHNQKEQNAK